MELQLLLYVDVKVQQKQIKGPNSPVPELGKSRGGIQWVSSGAMTAWGMQSLHKENKLIAWKQAHLGIGTNYPWH